MDIKEAVELLRVGHILENEANGLKYRHMNGKLEVDMNMGWVESKLTLLNFAEINFIELEEPEKTLSDKIKIYYSAASGYEKDKDSIDCSKSLFVELEDIKEFINQIKEGIKNKNYHQDYVDEISKIIDKKAGDRFK